MERIIDAKINEYLDFLNELRDEMSAKGLISDELDQILNDD